MIQKYDLYFWIMIKNMNIKKDDSEIWLQNNASKIYMLKDMFDIRFSVMFLEKLKI